jgi:hypothetical protein
MVGEDGEGCGDLMVGQNQGRAPEGGGPRWGGSVVALGLSGEIAPDREQGRGPEGVGEIPYLMRVLGSPQRQQRHGGDLGR